MATVLVRYYAAARAAAGMPEEKIEARTVAEVLSAVTARHGDWLAEIVSVASLLLDGVQVGDKHTVVDDGQELDILPPFAGGAV